MVDKNLDQTLWLQYLQALQGKMKLTGALEVLNPPPLWNWGGKDTLSGLPYAQYLTLDQVPSNPGSDAQVYGTKPGFGENYQLMMRQIDTTPGQKDPEYDSLNQQVTDTEGKYNNAVGDAKSAYKNYQNSTGTTDNYTTWLTGDMGFSYKTALSNAKLQVNEATLHLTKYLQARSGTVVDGIKQYSKNLTAIKSPDNPLTNSSYPGWSMAQKPYDYVNTITDNNFGGDATKGNAQRVSISFQSSQYDYKKTWGEADVGFLDFFLFDAEGSYSKVDTSTFSEQYSITFNFQDITTVDVSPGAWFNAAITTLAKSATFFEGFSAYESGANAYFFGNGGALSRMTKELVIGYRPTISIEGGQTFTSHMKKTIEGGGGLVIGPFVIGGAGGSTTEKDKFEFSGTTITATSKSDWPAIIGMTSDWVQSPTSS